MVVALLIRIRLHVPHNQPDSCARPRPRLGWAGRYLEQRTLKMRIVTYNVAEVRSRPNQTKPNQTKPNRILVSLRWLPALKRHCWLMLGGSIAALRGVKSGPRHTGRRERRPEARVVCFVCVLCCLSQASPYAPGNKGLREVLLGNGHAPDGTGPVQPYPARSRLFRVLAWAARTLNTTGPSRATPSLQ